MRSLLKFLGALIIALLAMLAFRAIAFTIYTVPGEGLEPAFLRGDRVMVNRWSYGLRTGGEGLFAYGRILRQPVKRGDLVAVNDSTGQVIICRCTAVPGDSVSIISKKASECAKMIVPGTITCADHDYYWMQPINRQGNRSSHRLGFIPEESIIGRVCLIAYNHNDSLPLWKGYHPQRWFVLP